MNTIFAILLIGLLVCNIVGLVFLSQEKFKKTTLNDTQKGFVTYTIIISWILTLLPLIPFFYFIIKYLVHISHISSDY